jgi:hypothetical protein
MSTKGMNVHIVLNRLVERQSFAGRERFLTIPKPHEADTKNNGAFVGISLKPVSRVVNDHEKRRFFLRVIKNEVPVYNEVLHVVLYNIENKAFKEMKCLDTKESSQTCATMMGLGTWYRDYLKKNPGEGNSAGNRHARNNQSRISGFYQQLHPL